MRDDNVPSLAELRTWCTLPADVRPDRLRVGPHTIVEAWELPVQVLLAEVVSTSRGEVLEIGYGLGMAAKALSARRPKAHWIVEAHPTVAQRALAEDVIRPPVSIMVVGLWQEVIPQLASGSFDGIAFDGYPIGQDFDGSPAATFRHIEPLLPHASRLLRETGVLAFIDFSRSLGHLPTFRQKSDGLFRRSQLHTTAVQPPPNCFYASGPLADVVTLIK